MSTPDISALLLSIKDMKGEDLVTLLAAINSEMQTRYEDMKAKAINWEAPTDGAARRWLYKEAFYYLRDAKNNVWHIDTKTGGLGDWKGRFIPEEDRIDSDADES